MIFNLVNISITKKTFSTVANHSSGKSFNVKSHKAEVAQEKVRNCQRAVRPRVGNFTPSSSDDDDVYELEANSSAVRFLSSFTTT